MTMDLGELVGRCALPEAAGMDALEARLIVVQEVPRQAELRFFAVRGEARDHLPDAAAHAVLRTFGTRRPPNELHTVELWAEVESLRAEADRLRPVYAAAKELRAVHDADERVSNVEVQQRCDCALCAAVDAALAVEGA